MKIYVKNVGATFEVVCDDEMIGWTTNYNEIENIVEDFIDTNNIEDIVSIIEM